MKLRSFQISLYNSAENKTYLTCTYNLYSEQFRIIGIVTYKNKQLLHSYSIEIYIRSK